jgi:quercetin dioxygenase-like cupin family protein
MRIKYLLLTAAALVFGNSSWVFAQGAMEPMRLENIKWGPCDPKVPQDPCQISYFRGNPEKEENHSMIKVPKGTAFPPHWHIHNEHIVITKGTFVIAAEGGQEKEIILKTGDYIYIPAKRVHWARFPEDSVFYLYVDGPDSYIDVKDKRP